MNSLAVDIGGTKIRFIVYSPKREIISEYSLPTMKYFHKEGAKDLHSVFSAMNRQVGTWNFQAVGISFNGVVKDKIIQKSSLLGKIENIDLEPILQKYFSFKEYFCDNDVFCMTKAENRYGIGKKHASFIFVNLGTGIRVVAVENNKLIRGYKNIAGEVCMNPLWVKELNSFLTIEEVISGRGIELLSEKVFHKKITAEKVFNDNNIDVITFFCTYLAQFLIDASFFYNPEIIVFGGSLIKSSSQWLPIVKTLYSSHPMKEFLATEIIVSKLDFPASLGALL